VRGPYSYRLKALRAPQRTITRSAQDAATACGNESVENFVVVARDEAEVPRAASDSVERGAMPPRQQQQQQAPVPLQGVEDAEEAGAEQRRRRQAA
jgi:hypothetical protein